MAHMIELCTTECFCLSSPLYLHVLIYTSILKLCDFGSCNPVTSHPHGGDHLAFLHLNNLGKTSFWVNFVRINCNFS